MDYEIFLVEYDEHGDWEISSPCGLHFIETVDVVNIEKYAVSKLMLFERMCDDVDIAVFQNGSFVGLAWNLDGYSFAKERQLIDHTPDRFKTLYGN